MKNLKINQHPKVELKFQTYSEDIKIKLDYLRNLIIETAAENDNINTAIESAIDKLSRQLRKLRDKVQDHKVVMKHVESHRGEELETEA